jgi:hypothetical protein
MNATVTPKTLIDQAQDCPAFPGVYRLYCGQRLLHIGMAAGAATLRSEILSHARGDYGTRTQAADRVEWEVAPDAVFAYRRFLMLYDVLLFAPEESEAHANSAPSASGRYT